MCFFVAELPFSSFVLDAQKQGEIPQYNRNNKEIIVCVFSSSSSKQRPSLHDDIRKLQLVQRN